MNNAKRVVDISVIIPTYNRDEVLRQTLECLLRQDPAPREIIVVDQTKNHNTETKQFLNKLITNGQISYLFQEEPNAQKARNWAITKASGEILLFLDDDVTMESDLIGAHWKNYCDDPQLAAVCGFYLEPGEQPLDILPDYCNRKLTGWIYTPHCYTKRIESYLLSTCNGSVRREIAIRLGGFDENYTHTLLDDTDFSCRLKQLGVKAVHDPEARLIHLKEPTGSKRPGGVNDYVIADANRWYIWCYFFWTNFGWRSWWELMSRLRRSVFRRKNLLRPWYLLLALSLCLQGVWRAARAIRGGRKLGFAQAASMQQSSLIEDSVTV